MRFPFLPLPLPLLLPFLSLSQAISVPQNYVNTAIARTVELVGATTQVTTQYNIKATSDGDASAPYLLALGQGQEPGWWEVSVGGKEVEGARVLSTRQSGGVPTVAVPLGNLKKGDVTTLSLEYILTHASVPLPETIEQKEQQYLVWKSNSTYVESWYPTDVERIKIRSPTPNIIDYTSPPDTYTRDSSSATKSSSTLTLGPFHSLPPTLGDGVGAAVQAPFSLHYESKSPVVGLRTLRRSAEVSHWGGNLNVQDEMDLVNNGPKLKGHFSRLYHQQARFHASYPPQVLTNLVLRLPPAAHSPYYYDTIGNVSTSNFRAGSVPAISTSQKKKKNTPRVKTTESVLELRPRYPLLGGWNYSCTIGYDLPLGEMLREDKEKGKNVLAVDFLTDFKDIVVDDVELRVILPEGAKNVEVFTPFPVDSISHSSHKTYLDSTGHHMITLRKRRCTERHAQPIYVTYDYPLSAQLQKPLTVATVLAGLFVFAMGLRRVDYSLDGGKKASPVIAVKVKNN